MGYGYRVYWFNVRRANKRTALDLCDQSAPFEDALCSLLAGFKGRGVVAGAPAYNKPSEISDAGSDPGARRSMLIRTSKPAAGHVSAQLVTGRIGDADWLIDGDGDDNDIRKRASGSELRVDFLLPKAGEKGVMVAECRGRTVHYDTLLRWLVHESYEAQGGDAGDQWLNYTVNQVIDVDYLQELMRRAQKVSVELEQTGVGGAGARKANHQVLSFWGLDKAVSDEIAKQASKWASGNVLSSDAVQALVKALGMKPKTLEDSNTSLSMPVIRIHADTGERLTVTPESVQEVFTYPLTDTIRPNPIEWQTAIQGAMDLALREKITLQIDDR